MLTSTHTPLFHLSPMHLKQKNPTLQIHQEVFKDNFEVIQLHIQESGGKVTVNLLDLLQRLSQYSYRSNRTCTFQYSRVKEIINYF